MINIFAQTPFNRQDDDPKGETKFFTFNPWSVQNVVFELVKLHMLRNNPMDDGFIIAQKYTTDPDTSQIHLGISYDWDNKAPKKRPAVFIQRDSAQAHTVPIRQTTQLDVKDSVTTKLSITTMPVYIKVIGTSVGDTEQLATWIRNAFLAYQLEIQQDFCFRRFRLQGMSPPRIYNDDKENFEVTIAIETVFDENFKVQREALRLKTVAFAVFDAVGRPFLNQ